MSSVVNPLNHVTVWHGQSPLNLNHKRLYSDTLITRYTCGQYSFNPVAQAQRLDPLNHDTKTLWLDSPNLDTTVVILS